MAFTPPNGDGGGSTGRIPPAGSPPSGGSTGGGNTGTSAVNLANLPVSGGLIGYLTNLLLPVFDIVLRENMIYIMDSNFFDTEEDVIYYFRVEEFEPASRVTINSILIRYRDIGKVTFTVVVNSADKQQIDYTPGTGNAMLITIGGLNDGQIRTQKVPLTVTLESPQIRIIRKAKSGPLDITKVIGWASVGDGPVL